MPFDPGSAFVGAAAGAISNELVEDFKEDFNFTDTHHIDRQMLLLRNIQHLLQEIARNTGSDDAECGEADEFTTIGPMEYALFRNGRKHAAIFQTQTAQSLTVSVQNMPPFTLNLNVGWTAADFPEGTRLTSAGSIPVMIRLSNEKWT